MKKTVLTIAGADPSGGAGIQADLEAFRALGVRGVSAITALTAQNNTKVKKIMPVPAAFLVSQIETLLEEFTISAVKIGMTGSSENVRAIGRVIKKADLDNIVLDPVMRSSSGLPLLDRKGARDMKKLLPLVTVVTPNIPEAEALTGMRIKDIAGMERASLALYKMGPKYVFIKGGHLSGRPVDVLFDGRRFYHFDGARIKGGPARFHGTGCMLSAALAASLAKGNGVRAAAGAAKRYVRNVLEKRGQRL